MKVRYTVMHGQDNRLTHASEKTIGFFGYSILVFSLVAAPICLFVYCTDYSDVFSAVELLWLLPALLLVFVTAKATDFMRHLSEKAFLGIMAASSIFISVSMILSYDTKPCSDYAMIYNAAEQMASGNFTSGTDPQHYMYIYNWQIGIAAFESLFVIVFGGGSFTALQAYNAILALTTQGLLYYTAKKKLGIITARYACVMAVLFLPWILSVPQFTNQNIALVLLLVGLLLLDNEEIGMWAASGAVIGLMNVLRPMGIIVVLAALCQTVHSLFGKLTIKPFKRAMAFVLCYVVVVGGFDALFQAVDYTDCGVSEARLTYFKFQKGLYGYNNELGDDLSEYGYDYGEYNAAMKAELFDKVIGNPIGTAVFVGNKMVRYLGLFDYKFEMAYNQNEEYYTQYPVKALYSTSWFQYLIVVALALWGLKSYRKKYRADVYQIFFVGNTLVYVFIEAFSSYRFENYAILIIFAAEGMRMLSKKEK